MVALDSPRHRLRRTRRITKSFRNAESCLSCSRGAAANEQVQPAAALCALRVFAVKSGSVSPREGYARKGNREGYENNPDCVLRSDLRGGATAAAARSDRGRKEAIRS